MILRNQNMNNKKCYMGMDTNSFVVYISYVGIKKDVETRFDTSNYELERPLPRKE